MAKTIADYKRDYDSAKARGDSAGMKAANDGANKIRESTGQAKEYAGRDIASVAAKASGGSSGGGSSGSGSTDYSAIIYSPSATYEEKVAAYNARHAKEQQMKNAGTWDSNWVPTDQLGGIINNMLQPQQLNPYEEIAYKYQDMQQNNNALAAKYYQQFVQQGTDRLNAQRGGINSSYDDAARQAYISYQQQQKALPQQMATMGMTGGATESSMVQQQSAYQGNLSSLEGARNKALNDISTAITDLQNSGDLQTAQYILANADKISEAYLNSLNSDISRRDTLSQQAQQNAFTQAGMNQDASQIAYSQQQDAYNRALQIAQATGNFSVMKQYGWTDEQIRAANQQMLPSSGSGSSSGGSRSQYNGGDAYLPVDYGDEQPTTGVTADQLLNIGTGIAAGSLLGNIINGTTPASQANLGTHYSTVWNNARRMFDNGKSADEIAKYLDMFDDAQLSDSGIEKILKSLNLYGVRGG